MKPFISYNKNLYNLNLTDSAHINYELMLDRYKISIKNNWQDEYGIFIYYSIGDMQKSRGYSKPKAIKILRELEEKGLIVKVYQKGKPTKIYLVQNEYTEFAQESMKNHKDNKNHKKVAPRKIAKQEQVINEVGVDEEVAIAAKPEVQEPEVTTITDYTADAKTADNSQSICDAFKAVIGREPDNSFKKCIARRAAQMNLTAENMRGIITLALKARNPEAYILSLTKPNNTYQPAQEAQAQEVEKPMEQWKIDWFAEIKAEEEQLAKQKAETEKPLEQWEIDWLNEIREYQAKEELSKQNNVSSLDTSEFILPEVRC